MAIEFEVEALAYGPEAIGRHQGRAVFVPLAIPGERVRAEIVEERKSYSRARLIEVLSPSPDRFTPPCPHFGACGGCHWQHLSYEAQLRWKRAVAAGQLTRIGGFADPPVRETIPSPSSFNYRNHVQFALTPGGKLGFRALQSAGVVPIRECHLIPQPLAELSAALDLEALSGVEQVSLRLGADDDDAMLIFEMEADGEAPDVELDLPVSVIAQWPDGSTLTLAGSDHLTQEVLGRRFRVSAGSFFQVNGPILGTFVNLVMETAQAGG